MQAALYQLVLDRRLGDYVLPDGWTVIAAGNYETDGAVSNKMGTALRSRFVHLDMETDVEDWCKWALTHNVNDIVRAFVRSFPHLLHVFDKTARVSHVRAPMNLRAASWTGKPRSISSTAC